jgi:CelD/BcsL family acetyltransferase involved in cellulose biosynthesis
MFSADMTMLGAELAYRRMRVFPRPAATTAPIRLSIISTVGGLRSCAPLWRELEDSRPNSTTLFQSFDWCSAWLRQVERSGQACEPFIIAAHTGCRLVLLWPMMVTRMAGLRVLRWLSDPWSQYGDVLADASRDVLGTMERALRLVVQSRAADAIWLRHVRADATAHAFLCGYFEPTGHSDGAPFMDLAKFAGEAEYLARYSKPQRKRRRQIRRWLEERGPLTFESYTEGSPFAQSVAAALAEKRRWLAKRGYISKPIFSSWLEDFLLALSSNPAAKLNVVCSVLKAGARPVAYEIALRYRDRHCCFITAHDGALTDDSPPRLHMDYSQRSALNEGFKSFDLMVPLAPHKESWASGHVEVSDFWLPLSTRGRLAGSLLFKLLRPLARHVYHSAPALRRAAGFLFR